MKILVCGGRDFAAVGVVFAALDVLDRKEHIDCVVHGDAKGADRIGGEWAFRRDREVRRYPADWNRFGRRAGPVRNAEMLASELVGLSLVVAFDGGTGTADMAAKARACRVPVLRVIGSGPSWTVDDDRASTASGEP